MLDDFPIGVETKDVDTRPIPVFVKEPLLVTMQNNVVTLGKGPLERQAMNGSLPSAT